MDEPPKKARMPPMDSHFLTALRNGDGCKNMRALKD